MEINAIKVFLKYLLHTLMVVDPKRDSRTIPAKTMRNENKTKPLTENSKLPFTYYVDSIKLLLQNLTQKLLRS